jgi:hypothetical protein
MSRKRQIPGEATRGLSVISAEASFARTFQREANVGGVSLQTRRALLQSVIPHYREASSTKKKSKLLDAFTATTEYNRKYAMWLLRYAKEVQP